MSIEFSWNPEDFNKLIRSCKNDTALPYIVKYMPMNGKVLEAGCGLARFVKFLKDRDYDIVGVELSQITVDTVRRLAPELDVRQGNIASLGSKDNSFSGIISLGVVEHFIEGPREPLLELYRVLRPGCYAIITVPSFNYLRQFKNISGIHHIDPIKNLKRMNIIRKFLGRGPFMPSDVPFKRKAKAIPGSFFEYLFTKREFENELENVGFTIVESVPICLIDGVYHEFGKYLVAFRDWTFYPSPLGIMLNSLLGKFPFLHNHMHLCVVTK
jgi:SAM-dependent methyltransferase